MSEEPITTPLPKRKTTKTEDQTMERIAVALERQADLLEFIAKTLEHMR